MSTWQLLKRICHLSSDILSCYASLLQRGAALTGTTTIGSGLVATGIRSVSSVGVSNTPAIARVVGVVGRGGALGLAFAGSAALVGLLGYAGYKLYNK